MSTLKNQFFAYLTTSRIVNLLVELKTWVRNTGVMHRSIFFPYYIEHDNGMIGANKINYNLQSLLIMNNLSELVEIILFGCSSDIC